MFVQVNNLERSLDQQFIISIRKCFCRIGQPLCLGQLVHYFGDDGETTITTAHAYLYATGVVMGSALYTLMHHPTFFSFQHTGMKIRVAACSVLLSTKRSF